MHRTSKVLLSSAILFATAVETSNLSAQIIQQERPRTRQEEWVIEQQRIQARERNLERQTKLKRDTDRLLELATELKQQVDRTDENLLSVDVIKKCEEIEKLAKDVKKKMKGS